MRRQGLLAAATVRDQRLLAEHGKVDKIQAHSGLNLALLLTEVGVATHSKVLACRIPRTEEPGGLSSMGSQRVRHDPSDSAGTHFCYLPRALGEVTEPSS